jgi:hypothetical protein
MKRATKKNSQVYQQLQLILTTGSPEEIARLKAEYWKQHRREWKQAKYKDYKCFKILLDPADVRKVTQAAKEHHLKPTSFIKQSALTNATESPRMTKAMVAKVREQFVLNYSAIEELFEEDTAEMNYNEIILKHLIQLEQRVLKLLTRSS